MTRSPLTAATSPRSTEALSSGHDEGELSKSREREPSMSAHEEMPSASLGASMMV
jgi:hypothetical protein